MNEDITFETVTPHISVNVEKLCTTYAYVYSPTFAFHGEKHEAWEIIYVSKGEVVIETQSKSSVVKSGQMYIHKPYDFHKIRANNTTCNIGIVSFCSKSRSLYPIADQNLDVTSYMKNLIVQIINEGMLCLAGKNNIPPLLKNEKREFASSQVIKNLLELLLIEIIRIDRRHEQHQSTSSPTHNEKNLVQNIKCLLAKNINTPITLKEISAELNYSVSHLCTSFKKHMGISIMNYFIQLRIERAKKLITDGEKTIKEISEELNFDTLQYFSYHFKKHTGHSPSQYASIVETYKIIDTAQQNKVALLFTEAENKK